MIFIIKTDASDLRLGETRRLQASAQLPASIGSLTNAGVYIWATEDSGGKGLAAYGSIAKVYATKGEVDVEILVSQLCDGCITSADLEPFRKKGVKKKGVYPEDEASRNQLRQAQPGMKALADTLYEKAHNKFTNLPDEAVATLVAHCSGQCT